MTVLIFATFIVLISYRIIKHLYKKFWDYKLDIEIFLPEGTIFEGDITSIKEVIVNDKLLPLPTFETRFQLDRNIRYVGDLKNTAVSDMLYRRDAFSLSIKQKISRTFDIVCIKRGYYTLSEIDLISSDLFMQQTFLGNRKCSKNFYVYPRKISNERFILPYRQIVGELSCKKSLYEDPFSFAGIRDYTPTDTMNSINWKASAKTQNLVVNTYESSLKQKVYIALDTFGNENLLNQDLNEEAIRLSAALISRLLLQGTEVTLIGNAVDKLNGNLLSLKDLKGLGMSVINQNLARLNLGFEKPIYNFFEQIPKDAYTIIISKNIDIEKEIVSSFKDFFWIIPFKETKPEVCISKHKYMTWRYEIPSFDKLY